MISDNKVVVIENYLIFLEGLIRQRMKVHYDWLIIIV